MITEARMTNDETFRPRPRPAMADLRHSGFVIPSRRAEIRHSSLDGSRLPLDRCECQPGDRIAALLSAEKELSLVARFPLRRDGRESVARTSLKDHLAVDKNLHADFPDLQNHVRGLPIGKQGPVMRVAGVEIQPADCSIRI